MPTLFLDIDGVLNGHKQHRNGFCGIDLMPSIWLDSIIEETDCDIILTSAWRYLLINGCMTLTGFRNMLLTHGIQERTADKIVGYLGKDNDEDKGKDRGSLVLRYMNSAVVKYPYLIVDDLDLQFKSRKLNFLQTNGKRGLTEFEFDVITRFFKTGKLEI